MTTTQKKTSLNQIASVVRDYSADISRHKNGSEMTVLRLLQELRSDCNDWISEITSGDDQ
jgi:hypothetical protein